MNKAYYIGLDGGTGSVGWAVTTPDYKLVKRNGKTLWGVRLFDTANTAEKRRMARSGRRRRNRQVQRLALLRELFAEEISKVDPAFYLRMDESFFYEEDKRVEGKYSLFADKDFCDKDYHEKYPTIYHLRKELMNSKEPHDIRLVYLAVHHILKHRGHFLYEGQSFNSVPEFSVLWSRLNEIMEDQMNYTVECLDEKALQEILSSESGISEKQKKLEKILYISGDYTISGMIKLLAGGKGDIAKDFDISMPKEDANILKLSFAEGDMESDEKLDEMSIYLGDKISVLLELKALYDWGMLRRILKDSESISAAKVKSYEKHHNNLSRLKKVIKEEANDQYDELFRSNKNYGAYTKNYDGEKGKTSSEDLYKALIKVLKTCNSENAKILIKEIEEGDFLPKQRTKDNSVLPYQIHQYELDMILKNASCYMPFLNEVDDSGITVIDKIKSLLTYRIPYYVGPLDNSFDVNENHWAVKKNNEHVLPWNFDQVVDKEQSAVKFMEKLTNTCTYLIGEPVLAKESVLYSRFMVLNELNNVRIYGEKLSVELKQRIYTEIFLKYRQVTGKRLFEYLLCNGYLTKADKDAISGIDKDFKGSLKTEIRFREIFTENLPSMEQMDEIVKAILLFSQEPSMLDFRIRAILPQITDDQLKKVRKIKCTGWGRLSKKLLTEICVPMDGYPEGISITKAMWNTQENFMQLLSQNYSFSEEIENYNRQFSNENVGDYQTIDELPVPPNVKRPIWQTVKIVKEIQKIMGYAPEKVFIEMARGGNGEERSISRKNKLLIAYADIEKSTRDWISEIKERSDDEFRKDILFLYYTQMGRCMYTGEPIDLDNLLHADSATALYDIDHIWPQSRIKDDSIENRVLVKKIENGKKGDKYPIKEEIRSARKGFWDYLYKNKLIGKTKYERLIRNTEFDADELAGFINRQLVETRQSTKAAAKVLAELLPESHIVYAKAGNVSDFRLQYDLIKIRDLNDLHHAKDAYLTIVVGNIFDVRFTADPWKYINTEWKTGKDEYSIKPKVLYFQDIQRNGVVAWKKGKNGSIAIVKDMYRRNNAMITYQTVRRNHGQNGGFYDQNIVSGGIIPIKGNDERLANTQRYGGYNGDTGAYMILVEHGKAKKRVRSIETVYLRYANLIDKQPEMLDDYCRDVLKLENPKILLREIKYNTLIDIGGFAMYITGRSNGRLIGKQAFQLCLSQEDERYLKKIIKVVERYSGNKEQVDLDNKYDDITREANERLYNEIISKYDVSVYINRPASQKNILISERERFRTMALFDQCRTLCILINSFRGNGEIDLSSLGGSRHAGNIKVPSTMKKGSKCYVQSITGFFQQDIFEKL